VRQFPTTAPLLPFQMIGTSESRRISRIGKSGREVGISQRFTIFGRCVWY